MKKTAELRPVSFEVPAGEARAPLDRVLRGVLGLSWERVRRAIETGKVTVDGRAVSAPTHPVAAGARIELDPRARSKGGTVELDPRALVHVDPYVVVVNKPAGISTVPFEDERGTLIDLVRTALRKREGRPIPPLGLVQRLDKDTSGIIVFARTLEAKRHLKQQLRFHTAERRYVALAHGDVAERTLRSHLIEDRGDGLRGSTTNARVGQLAVTHLRVLERLSGATLVECRLETGRTHQIRIHLSEAGHPLVGERVYVRDFQGPRIGAPRLMLHARELGFEHPHTEEHVRFESPLPPDFVEKLSELGGRAGRAPRAPEARAPSRPKASPGDRAEHSRSRRPRHPRS